MDEATVSPEGRLLLQTLTDSIRELNSNIITLTHTVQDNEIARIESEARISLSLQQHDQRIAVIEAARVLEAKAADTARKSAVEELRHRENVRVGKMAALVGLLVWVLDHAAKLIDKLPRVRVH